MLYTFWGVSFKFIAVIGCSDCAFRTDRTRFFSKLLSILFMVQYLNIWWRISFGVKGNPWLVYRFTRWTKSVSCLLLRMLVLLNFLSDNPWVRHLLTGKFSLGFPLTGLFKLFLWLLLTYIFEQTTHFKPAKMFCLYKKYQILLSDNMAHFRIIWP